MARLHHEPGSTCPLCAEKLATADSRLITWFLKKKEIHPEIHVSWAWRGQADQDRFFREGKTFLKWPESEHNHMEHGVPCARALDLFCLTDKGQAIWDEAFFARLASECEKDGDPILWGGNFRKLGDGDHFQLRILEA